MITITQIKALTKQETINEHVRNVITELSDGAIVFEETLAP